MLSKDSLPSWQESMKRAIRRSDELLRTLGIPVDALALSADGEKDFPVFVTHEYLSRIEPGNPSDPLLLQVLPVASESVTEPGDLLDPVGDWNVESAPGLLHKYRGRVLLIANGACAIHCRYCFRRHYPYETSPKTLEQWEKAIERIESDPSIHEVILSGGDPLTLVDDRLAALIHRIERIPHIKRLRIHSRLPIVLPQRVTPELVRILQSSRLAKWFVLHANHGNEIDQAVSEAIVRLRDAGCTMLNQAVLLRDVNDNEETLVELFEKLVNQNVVPYYLNQLDRVAGASHFAVPVERGLELVKAVRSRLPGYAVPIYVQEESGETSKTPLETAYFARP
jgi:L-lysine 2,3-aminomutase